MQRFYFEIYRVMMTANEIRESFKQFFQSKGHLIVPSAPIVVKDDPTLMFTNAGMNQFKDIIFGKCEAQEPPLHGFAEMPARKR